jgi:hypothetical protein
MQNSIPTLIISYDRLLQKINAQFFGQNLTPLEEQALVLLKSKWETQMLIGQFLHSTVNYALFSQVTKECQDILNQVYQETGIKFNLDNSGLRL